MRRKRIISLVLSACLIVGSAVQGGAATTQEKISDAKAQQQANQSSLQQTQEKIQELESKKGESETYLADLNTQLDDLRSSLEKLQNDYDAKQEELTQLQSDLEDAKADEAQQYEAMKLRIRYMYENSASDYMNLLFESGSISDFLNQAENISQMSKYDRDMLDTYRETKEAIQTKEEQVAQEKEEIVALQQESADKQAAVEELVEATYQQIREYQEDIQSQLLPFSCDPYQMLIQFMRCQCVVIRPMRMCPVDLKIPAQIRQAPALQIRKQRSCDLQRINSIFFKRNLLIRRLMLQKAVIKDQVVSHQIQFPAEIQKGTHCFCRCRLSCYHLLCNSR